MKKVLLLLAVVLSGCQTGSPYHGTGPIVLSDYTVKKYRETYLTKPGTTMFYVSKDGRYSGYWYCSTGPGACRAARSMELSLNKCAEAAGVPCYVFDEGGWVVWKGLVTWGSQGPDRAKPQPPEDLTDLEVCAGALAKGSEGERWSSKAETVPFVVEATGRNFSPTDCYQIILKK